MDLNYKILSNVKFGLLTAVEIEEQIFNNWHNTQSIPIDWLPLHNIDSVDHIENKIFQEYYIVEKFYLDKQLFVGKRGSFDPIRPIRGIAHRPIKVRYKLSSRDIVLNFSISFAYFKPHNVLQVFLFTDITNIFIDDLIFIKQSKWYQVEGEGWQLSVNYTDKQPKTINQLCDKVLKAYRLNGMQDKGHPCFDFIELQNIAPSTNPSFEADVRLTKKEHYGLVTGDEGFRLLGENNEQINDFLIDPIMNFGTRNYFHYQFTSTSCVCFFSKNRQKIRNEWSSWYKKNVGFIPSLYTYTSFSNEMPCIGDGVLLLIERCLLRYIELTRMYEYLIDSKDFVFIKRIFNKLIGKEKDKKVLTRLDHLDLIVDNSLWIIAQGYEKYLFGYKNLNERVVKAIERKSKFLFERVTIIIGISTIIIASIALFDNIWDKVLKIINKIVSFF